MEEKVYEISVKQLFTMMLKRWWMLLLSICIGAALAFCYSSFLVTPTYRTTATLGVNNTQITSYYDIIIAQQMAEEGVDILTSDITLNRAVEKLKADERTSAKKYTASSLRGMISTEIVNESRYFKVGVTSTNPEEAQIVCQYVLDAFCEAVVEEELIRDGEGKVINYPVLPTSPSSPNVTLSVIVGALVGFVICMAILVIDYFSKDSIDGEDWLIGAYKDKIPMLAVIPDANTSSKSYKRYYSKYGYGYGYEPRR